MFRTLVDIVIKLAALGFLLVCILVALLKAQLAPIELIPGVVSEAPPPIPERCGQIEDVATLDEGCRQAWLANRRHFLGRPPVLNAPPLLNKPPALGQAPILGKPVEGTTKP